MFNFNKSWAALTLLTVASVSGTMLTGNYANASRQLSQTYNQLPIKTYGAQESGRLNLSLSSKFN
ncbi:hypothetical protein DSM106972_046380 [Dulcicalothrix desertica PCC 7102]|uniref:Uncharacterized protein n=1 Tax=Dulcicalothrix desertica PCC 7102 TaxID=232991 RepID=A0A3S1CKB1_9CYAN|nr:hypothetical protein DSM106972_046380 [Dulcicalothrix desertica PCC 7102]TWH51264.1 hypothetical protein CAL7102_05659 [Dulcicalothrix desertica PCC 7102]